MKKYYELEIKGVSFGGINECHPNKMDWISRNIFSRQLGSAVKEEASEKDNILENIDLQMGKGERLALLGPSGCGKTTLLRIVAGLEQNFNGEIRFQGKNMATVPPHKRNFGMMFQDFALFPHRNVFENISFGLEMKNESKQAMEKRVDEMLELVNLEGYGNREIKALSGGERQRVALARTLAPKPDLMMLDEPLGALDRLLRERLLADLCTILDKTNMTAILVTHDHQEAFAASDLVCVLIKGRVAQVAPPSVLFRSPETKAVADFLGFQNIFTAFKHSDETLVIQGLSEKSKLFLVNLKSTECSSECAVSRPLQSMPVMNTETRSKRGLEFQNTDKMTILIMPDAAIPLSEAESQQLSENVISGKVIRSLFQGAFWKVIIETELKNKLYFNLSDDALLPGKNEFLHLKIKPTGIKILNESKTN